MEHGKARIWQENKRIPTYELGEEERLPIFYKLRGNQGTRGDIYPYKNKDTLTLEKNESHTYQALCLENDYIRVTVLPELGGRIYEGYDKINDYNFVYKNQVIKPALIGMNGAWISGGIEFNWPQHHRPTTYQPVQYTIEKEPDGSLTAWVGETESRLGQKCLMGVSIHPERSLLTVKVKLYNPTAQKENFHWWANLAVPVNDRYRLLFPPDIDYVTYHDRTHVSPFPKVKGEFAGTDFGPEGTDIRWVKNLKPASSFFIFDSEYSFMGGYDDGADMGTVHVADHFLSPGKKFFTWGRSDYGEAWQKNLTDEDGDYIEIMTGCFTDNQPDFTWVMPYETKTFEQHWYSLHGIKELKNATTKGAVGVWEEDGTVKVAFNVTAPGAVTLKVNEEEHCFDAVPGEVYTVTAPGFAGVNETVVALLNKAGDELVSWYKRPAFFEDKEKPQPRRATQKPQEIDSNDELWINGMHLEQYKATLLRPDPWYLEALRRDAGDLRCNTALGVLNLRRGKFKEAVEYLQTAVKRATQRNPNPIDAECYYQLGLAWRALGQPQKALAALKRSAWTYAWKSAALQQSAELENTLGDADAALSDLNEALRTNAVSLRTLAQRNALLIRRGEFSAARASAQQNLAWDPLDAAALFTLHLCGEPAAAERLLALLGKDTAAWLQLAETYLAAGLYDEGIAALKMCPAKTVLQGFYLAWAASKIKDEAAWKAALATAETAKQEEIFPNSAFDFCVLKEITDRTESALAPYYLGCMYCARDVDDVAADYWKLAVQRNPNFADAHRALAQVEYEALKNSEEAKKELEKALKLRREARVFFEYYQLNKVLGADNATLLALLENNRDLVEKRQDLTVQYIERLCRAHRLEEAEKLLATAKFYAYEGGEGQVPAIHAFAAIVRGMDALATGDGARALACFRYADTYPEQFHEGARFQERRAHLQWFLALGCEAVRDTEAMQKHLCAAAAHYDDLGISQFFKGQALRKLGRQSDADALYRKLKEQAQALLSDTEHPGFCTNMPYEETRRHTVEMTAYPALFLGQLGLEERKAAAQTVALMQKKGLTTYWIDYLAEKL